MQTAESWLEYCAGEMKRAGFSSDMAPIMQMMRPPGCCFMYLGRHWMAVSHIGSLCLPRLREEA